MMYIYAKPISTVTYSNHTLSTLNR